MCRLSKILAIVAVVSMMICFASCKANKSDSPETHEPAPTSVVSEQTKPTETQSEANDFNNGDAINDVADTDSDQKADDPSEDQPTKLPEYEYPGDDPLQIVMTKYLIQEFGKYFASADVRIPSMTIVATDLSNPEDIRVWGDFWIFNYRLEHDTLITESGGSHPGLMHLKKSDDGYKVTKMDVVADGADNLKSAKVIFGDKYEDFHKINSNQDEREKARLQFISDYVKKNKLQITKVKDFGWEPVELP